MRTVSSVFTETLSAVHVNHLQAGLFHPEFAKRLFDSSEVFKVNVRCTSNMFNYHNPRF